MSCSWQIPNEIWRIIIRHATFPEDVSSLDKDSDETRIARIFDPASIGDQCRFPWRKEFKPPVDTVTSLRTKYALTRVSHRFYALSCEFLYETLYLRHFPGIKDLAKLYITGRGRQFDDGSDMRRWTKYVHIWIKEGMEMIDIHAWTEAVASIIGHTSPIGFVQIYDISRPPSHIMSQFWQSQAGLILRAVPSCVKYMEWQSTGSSDWLDIQNGPVMYEMLRLWRRAVSLRALRIEASKITIPPHTDITLPQVTYMDINASCHDLSGLCFPSLTHFASPFYLQRLWKAGSVPALAYICLDSMWSFSSGLLRTMIDDVPALRKLCVFPTLSVSTTGVERWIGTKHLSLRCIEVHIARPGRWLAFKLHHTHYDDVCAVLARLERHILPFGDVAAFPALERFELRGLRYVMVGSEENRTELYSMVLNHLVAMTARGVEIVLED